MLQHITNICNHKDMKPLGYLLEQSFAAPVILAPTEWMFPYSKVNSVPTSPHHAKM